VREDQQLAKSLIKSTIMRVQRKCGFLSMGSSFTCVPGFSLLLDPRGRMGGLNWKVWSACEEFQDWCEQFLQVG